MWRIVLLVISLSPACAQTVSSPEPASRATLWKFSLGALTVASVLDTHSSWAKCCEANPLLPASAGRFGAPAAAVKAGALGAQVIFQIWAVRKWPKLARPLGILNFGTAGVLTGVAVRNYGIPRARGSR